MYQFLIFAPLLTLFIDEHLGRAEHSIICMEIVEFVILSQGHLCHIDTFIVCYSCFRVSMSFSLKKFETADEVEEKKRKRQEEWEKVRQPDEPLGVYV